MYIYVYVCNKIYIYNDGINYLISDLGKSCLYDCLAGHIFQNMIRRVWCSGISIWFPFPRFIGEPYFVCIANDTCGFQVDFLCGKIANIRTGSGCFSS